MDHDDPARDPLLFYPAHNLSPEAAKRIDDYQIEIGEAGVDGLIYSLSRQVEMNFQTFYAVAEQVVGEDKALEIAKAIGRQYGGKGYERFLTARGTPGVGSARHMAQYQDLVHSLRGPKHAAALYAEYDDERCVVKRGKCIYYNEEHPQNGKYVEAFEAGCFEGYRAADRNLLRVEVHRCLCQGASSCEQHWVYEEPDADGASA